VVSFAEPTVLWLLIAPALASVLVVVRHRLRMVQQRRLASPGVWRRLMGGTPATGLLRMLAWCVAAALVVVALARPQWGELPAEESVRTRDLVVALDVSDSMLCPDLRPSRLARSLEVLVRALPGFEGNRVGVVVFAGEAYPLVPVTTDLNAVAAFLDGVRPQMVALPGSNLERAADAALRLLPAEGEGRVLVLMTDGENLQGDVVAAAERLREAGVGVLAVVAGTAKGGPIPVPAANGAVHYKRDAQGQPVVTRAQPEVLQELAAAVDGEVLQLTGDRVVPELIDSVGRLRTREIEATRTVQRVERFPIFLVAAAAMLGLGFALSPWRRMATVAAVIAGMLAIPAFAQDAGPAPTAPAGSRDADHQDAAPSVAWWQRLIPGGSRRLARSGAGHWRDGDLAPAAEDFAGAAVLDPENPERLYDLGTTLAAAGDLESAVPLLAEAHDGGVAAAAYNGGTASLLQQQAEPAVQWLRQALLTDPEDVDAKRNYELALQMLQQQQEQQQDQQQEKQQDQDQDQEQEQPPQQEPSPTPSESPTGAPPTPTPDHSEALFAALDREEAEAREQMRSPTPQASQVERDW
jgi:Ca-activated chloride channel family protein